MRVATDARVRWGSLLGLHNWRPLIVLTVILFLLIIGAVRSPLTTFVWTAGTLVSIPLSLVLHELGHATAAFFLGFKVNRLLVIGGGRRRWKSKNGAVVVNSFIRRRIVMSHDGTNGVLSVNLAIEGSAAIDMDENIGSIRTFAVVAAAPSVNAIVGIFALLVGFYPLMVISWVMLAFSLLGGPGSDGWQMAAILRGVRYNPSTGRYNASMDQICFGKDAWEVAR